jgi:uncharacterized protein (TIGR00251 family)
VAEPQKERFHHGAHGAALAVRVIPNAPKTQITAVMDDGTIKIKVAAPPVDGKANAVLVSYLARVLSVAESQIDIVAGQTGRNKLISIINLNVDEVNQRILAVITKQPN